MWLCVWMIGGAATRVFFFFFPVSSSLSDEPGERGASARHRRRVMERGRQIAWRGQREGRRKIINSKLMSDSCSEGELVRESDK